MRTRILALVLLCAGGPAYGQQGSCQIVGQTMTCPNGVTIGGIGQSVFFGNRSLDRGTGDRQMPDGREVFDLGNKGIVIGGQGEAERQTEPLR